jgi:signal transduction histidine kinase
VDGVGKRAGVQDAFVSLRRTQSSIEFSVRDDGVGFDPRLSTSRGEPALGLGIAVPA